MPEVDRHRGREQTTRNICCFLFTNNPKTTGNAECLEKTACSHVYFSMFKARECEYLLDGRGNKKTGIETKENETGKRKLQLIGPAQKEETLGSNLISTGK